MSPEYINAGVAVAALAGGWFASAFAYRNKRVAAHEEQTDRLEIHRDDLTFELLREARNQVTTVHAEIEELRAETRTLRELEKHFFHFQQSLDHIEAIITAEDPGTKAVAERNARAFLMRMRRLAEAEGTIRNEVQTAASRMNLADDILAAGEASPDVPPRSY